MTKQVKESTNHPKTLMELHKILADYMPGKQTTARKVLEEGMRKAQDIQDKFQQASPVFEPGNFNPFCAPEQEFCNIDILISRRLGGRRVGNMIEWIVKEGVYRFNWATGEVKKV